jgi:hypothetical protein
MKKTIFVLFFILSGCDNSAENKKNFEECVQQAERKYDIAFLGICKQEPWHKNGECSYSIETNKALLNSKNTEINACAMMYAPKR